MSWLGRIEEEVSQTLRRSWTMPSKISKRHWMRRLTSHERDTSQVQTQLWVRQRALFPQSSLDMHHQNPQPSSGRDRCIIAWTPPSPTTPPRQIRVRESTTVMSSQWRATLHSTSVAIAIQECQVVSVELVVSAQSAQSLLLAVQSLRPVHS